MDFQAHLTSCCARHGCHLGDKKDCPVYAGALHQEKPCKNCIPVHQLRTEMKRLQEEYDWSMKLECKGLIILS